MGHRCQNIENIDVLLSIIDVFNIDIALSMSMCKYGYKVSMSIFFRCFYSTSYTFCLLASCRTWLVNSIRDIDFSSETVGKNQSSSAARQQTEGVITVFFMDHVFHDFAISHYIQEILCPAVVFGIQFMQTVTINIFFRLYGVHSFLILTKMCNFTI